MICSGEKIKNAIDNVRGSQTQTLNLLIGGPTASQPSQQHPLMLIAVMILLDLIGIYVYKTEKDGQQRLAKGQGSARFQISPV